MEELESTVAELEGALQQQQVEASDAVEQWSARWTELDSLKSDLERHLETVSKERDDLSGMLQYERENGGKEALAQAELEHSTERAEWEAEKESMQTRIDEQNESLLASSQSLMEANDELSQTRKTAEETVDAWKRKSFCSSFDAGSIVWRLVSSCLLAMSCICRSCVRNGSHHPRA